MISEEDAEFAGRFWARVLKIDTCWDWIGAVDRNGYGKCVGQDGKKRLAHREAYRLSHDGVIPEHLGICHSCDNPSCCNPAHLWAGTQGENLRDMATKGRGSQRMRGWQHRNPEWCVRGEKSKAAKLSDEKVRDIRRRFGAGESYAALGKAFGVVPRSIRDVVKRVSWGHVA